jgi:hypothetical protein
MKLVLNLMQWRVLRNCVEHARYVCGMLGTSILRFASKCVAFSTISQPVVAL